MTDGAGETPARERVTPARLRRRQDFLAASGGKRFHTERMSVQARLRGEPETRDGATADGLYVGFTLTKRVGHATERNRIRRRLRRAVELAAVETVSLPADIVVIGRRPALSAPFETLVEDLRRALGAATKARHGASASGGGRHSSPPQGAPGKGSHVPRRRGSGRSDTAPNTQKTTPHGSIDG